MDTQREMQDKIDQWVAHFIEGDADAAVAMYTPDGAIYSPYYEAALGIDAVRTVHQHWMAKGQSNKKLQILEARTDGKIGYQVVEYSGDYPQDDGSAYTETGYSVNIVRKQADSSWKFHISSLNSEVPPLASDKD